MSKPKSHQHLLRQRRITVTLAVDESDPVEREFVRGYEQFASRDRRAAWVKRQVLLGCAMGMMFERGELGALLGRASETSTSPQLDSGEYK